MSNPLHTAQINTPDGVIDLGRGDPQFSLLPLELIRQAAGMTHRESDREILQYGAEQGGGRFRLALADFLSEGYGFPVDADTLFVTSGISSALDLFCTLFTLTGDTVFVEEPSYFLALRIFTDHGLRLVSIPTDSSGLVVDLLEEALVVHHPSFLYLIPAFQNPSGHTLTQERRERLLAISKEHNLLVLADEVYQFLNYTIQPPKCFGAYTDMENVVSLGSFSKILAPGLRLGWVQANPKLIQRLAGCGLLESGGGMNPFTSAIVRLIIESGGLRQNIDHLVQVYFTRVKVMDESLRRHLPQAEYVSPHGGYFFWLRLPGIDTQDLRQHASAHQVDYRPGILFSSQGALRDYLRLSISFYDGDEIDEAVQRLAQCLQTQKDNAASP